MFLVGPVGGLVTYATTAVARRSAGDPEAVAYALGTAALGVAAGFVWLSSGWPAVERGPGNGFAAFIGYGNIWVPVLVAGLAALCLLVWWTHPEAAGYEDESATPGSSDAPVDETS